MTIKELRIGNIIRHNVKDPQSPTGWCEPNEAPIDENDMNIFLITDNQFPEAEPVKLTEEWLLKFGFKYGEDEDFDKDYSGRMFFKTGIQIVIQPDNDTHLVKCPTFLYGYPIQNCRYLHELQNLYFAVIGEELTIK